MIQLLRTKHVTNKLSRSKTSLYRQIQDGLIPPPVKVNGCSYWLDSEIQEIIQTEISGASIEARQKMTTRIIKNRQPSLTQAHNPKN
ncbi:MAG TPA: AlpA family phage regulatory protein [Methylococcaceae bacterium]|nr:AlpA family phage regulatory protein [Methylococcaceae bacterium]